MSLIALVFPKLMTPKNVVAKMHSSSCLRTPSDSQRVNGSQTLQNSSREHFYPIFFYHSEIERAGKRPS